MLATAAARAGAANGARLISTRLPSTVNVCLNAGSSAFAARQVAPLPWQRLQLLRPKSSMSIPLPGVAQEAAADAGQAAAKVARALEPVGTLVTPGYETRVGIWLVGTCGLLYSMIGIGGYTRLSGSGLSMTDWRIQGRRLPFSQAAWEREFEEYKKYPEYQRLHAGKMELDDFKRIYFVEWFHRMWGRSAGIFFAMPLGYWAWKGVFRARLGLRLTGLLGLGLSQAFVGWWMVRSGFDAPEKHVPKSDNKRPRVSPYRLASHWAAALTLYCGCVWSAMDMLRPSPATIHGTSTEAIKAARKLRKAAIPAAALVGLTMLSGPFVAGNDAGHAYNTWPKMNYDWVPPEWIEAASAPLAHYRSFFEETAVVQFDHRMLAYSSVASTLGVYVLSLALPVTPAVSMAVRVLPLAVTAQMCLGIATLMLYVPIELGVAHQAGGVAVLTALMLTLHTLRLPPVAVAVAVGAAAASAVA